MLKQSGQKIHIVLNIKAPKITRKFTEIFSIHRITKISVTDEGTPFTSSEFYSFFNKNAIKLKLTAPYNPSTKCQAERMVQMVS